MPRSPRCCRQATWVAAAWAARSGEVNQWCLAEGGHVRTGLEDNLRIEPDRLAASNAELVRKVVDACDRFAAGGPDAPPRRARSTGCARPPDRPARAGPGQSASAAKSARRERVAALQRHVSGVRPALKRSTT